mmetsp:Transcript_233/g.399  ORF Transcript_233/g.399 Transcript_233/m.399 type:complete len:237 (-) Transcript_233:1432-2142(-)
MSSLLPPHLGIMIRLNHTRNPPQTTLIPQRKYPRIGIKLLTRSQLRPLTEPFLPQLFLHRRQKLVIRGHPRRFVRPHERLGHGPAGHLSPPDVGARLGILAAGEQHYVSGRMRRIHILRPPSRIHVVIVRQIQSRAAVAHVHEGRDPRSLREVVHERTPQDIVGDLPLSFVVDRDDRFVVPVDLHSRLVGLLPSVSREVEEEDVAASYVLHEPCECLGDHLDGGLILVTAIAFVGQ